MPRHLALEVQDIDGRWEVGTEKDKRKEERQGRASL